MVCAGLGCGTGQSHGGGGGGNDYPHSNMPTQVTTSRAKGSYRFYLCSGNTHSNMSDMVVYYCDPPWKQFSKSYYKDVWLDSCHFNEPIKNT